MMEKFEEEVRNDERIKCAVNGLLEGLTEQVVKKINRLTDEQLVQVKQLYENISIPHSFQDIEYTLEVWEGDKKTVEAILEGKFDEQTKIISEVIKDKTDKQTDAFKEKLESVADVIKAKIRNSADLARKENFAKGLPIIYMDKDRDIVYEYPDGSVKKKKDIPEDEWLSKRYDNRLDLPEDKYIQLKSGESAIIYYNKNKKNKEQIDSEADNTRGN